MTLAYFAYPIDVVTEHGARDGARDLVRQAMHSAGWAVFEPGTTFRMGEGTSEELADSRIQEINDQAIDRADVVVALLPVESHSVGVPIEIQRAAYQGRTVLVWRQRVSQAIAQKNVWQYVTVEALVEAIGSYQAIGSWGHTFLCPATEPAIDPSIVRWTGTGHAPVRAHADDAGFDLYVAEGCWLGPSKYAEIPCHVSIEWPIGWWALLTGRSSSSKRGLLVSTTVVDPGYRGELFAVVRNVTDDPIRIERGERIHQVVPIPAFPPGVPVVHVDQLSDSHRGEKGFGSSGR